MDMFLFFSVILVCLLIKEKRDKEMLKAGHDGSLDGLTKEEIWERRAEITPVERSVVPIPAESDDEESKQDLIFRRRLFLKKARSVASARRTKGRMLLEAMERPGSSQLHVRDVLKLAEANMSVPQASAISAPPNKVLVPESPLSTQGEE